MPKAGTVLLLNIVSELLNQKPYHRRTYPKKAIGLWSMEGGGISNVEDKKIMLNLNYFTDIGTLEKRDTIDISDDINGLNSCLLYGHIPLSKLKKNRILKTYKKIFIYRNIFDIIHSNMQFIHHHKEIYELMNKLDSREDFIKLNYFTPSFLAKIIEEWKIQVNDFLVNSQNTFGIKYEELITKPKKVIKELASYLNIYVTKEKIDTIIESYFFKEIYEKRHKHYSHFVKTKKIGKWMEYIPKNLFEEIYMETREELSGLQYDKPVYNSDSNKAFKKNMELKYKNWKSKDRWKVFINSLNKQLENKRYIIYGNGEYSKKLQLYLERNPIFIVDKVTNPISYQELLLNVDKYEYILLAVGKKNHKEVYEIVQNIKYGDIEIIDGYNIHIEKMAGI
jgi:hypothetical protein